MRSRGRLWNWGVVASLTAAISSGGCAKHRASVTAVPLSPWNQCEPEGIPYYLPKPLLVVAKNVRHIDEAKVGLTASVPIPNSFDNQAGYADLKANVTFPSGGAAAGGGAGGSAGGGTPNAAAADGVPDRAVSEAMTPGGRMEDGIAPDSFYTYQIVFIPDLSQKYGLRIKGGPGEIRAAMNLVNGWMYTGMGPFYLKDSSTAQNLMAFGAGSMFAGRGVADVLNEVSDLARVANPAGGTPNAAPASADVETLIQKGKLIDKILAAETKVPQKMCNYAEVYIYEPSLSPEGTTCWSLVAQHTFDRDYFQSPSAETSKRLMDFILSPSGAAANPATSLGGGLPATGNGGPAAAPAGGLPPAPAPAAAPAPMPDTESTQLGAPGNDDFRPMFETSLNSVRPTPVSWRQGGGVLGGGLPGGGGNSQTPAVGNPKDKLVPATGAAATTNQQDQQTSKTAGVPTLESVRDPIIEEFERTMLKLPPQAPAAVTSTVPVNNIDVNVDLGRRRPVGPGLGWLKHQPPARPKNRTRSFTSTVSGAASAPSQPTAPGAGVQN